jgi:hypothetical protein
LETETPVKQALVSSGATDLFFSQMGTLILNNWSAWKIVNYVSGCTKVKPVVQLRIVDLSVFWSFASANLLCVSIFIKELVQKLKSMQLTMIKWRKENN